MMRRILGVLIIFLLYSHAVFAQGIPSCRDAKTWPFAQNSIWNTPIGTNAQFVPANLTLPRYGYDPEENVIVMTPDAPLTTIQEMVSGGWDGSQQARCASTGHALNGVPQVPVPADFVTLDRMGGNQPNAAGAFLLRDGHSLVQNQPVTRCSAGGELLSKWPYDSDDILTGDGIRGAQGGTGMSSLGGAIRINEMVSGGQINHALKMVLFGIENLYFDRGAGVGYRWPAYKHDSGAEPGACDPNSNTNEYCGSNAAFKIGALLALPNSIDINSLGLQAESSKMMARAMQNYGIYAVDNSAWSNIGIAVEFGPAGDGKSKLQALGGFNQSDLDKIFSRLQIVNDNSQSSVGGAGTRRVPVAPPFCGVGVTPGVTPVVSPSTPPSTSPAACPKKSIGDADCNGTVSLADYSIWRSEFQGTATTKKADFNTDTKVSLADYSIWRTTFGKGTNPSGAPSPTGVTPTTPVGSCVGGKTTTVKIMPLGDSVTDGTDGRGGYRFKLYNLLKGNNTLFDYVGPNQSGTVPDQDHAGYGGYQVGRVNDTTHGNHMISKEIPTIIPQYAPDVVLFMGGVNDMFGGYENTPWTVDEVGQNVIEAVKQVNALRPSSTIIVASLTSWGPNDTGDSNRLSINAAIKAGVATLKAQGKPIVYAESMADQVTNQYTPTDVHPSADGYDKMADVWFSYLNPLLCK